MKVVEVPAHRLYQVSNDELREYELLDPDGKSVSHWSTSSFALAVKGRRVFRKARFRPNDYEAGMHYLEEV